MFSFSITQQLIVFLQSFGFGFLIGIVYSLSDFLFGLILPEKIKNIVSDVIFCIAFALLLFCFVLAYNLGKLRLYLILGVFLGVVIYAVTMGDIISRVFTLGERIVLRLRNILFSPFRRIVSFLSVICKKIRRFFETKLNKSIAKENKSSV